MSKEDYDANNEASRIQTFLSKFKDRQLDKKIKDKIKKIDRSNHSIK